MAFFKCCSKFICNSFTCNFIFTSVLRIVILFSVHEVALEYFRESYVKTDIFAKITKMFIRFVLITAWTRLGKLSMVSSGT